jgi:outer membrane protein assembly factor BamB/TolA-binding protein
MAATQLIDLLENQGLLDPEVISELRRQVEQSKTRITTEAIAKLLVDNNQLTRFQATKLISQLKEESPESSSPAKAFSNPISGPTKDPNARGDEMDLIPDELVGSITKSDPNQAVNATVFVNAEEVELVEDNDKLMDAEGQSKFDEPEAARSSKQKVTSSSEDPFNSLSGLTDTVNRGFVQPKKIVAAKPLQWDAFRIWGYGFALMALGTAFTGLIFWFNGQGADGAFKIAMDAYESLDYEVAIEKFKNFSESYSSDDRAGRAKVYTAIATIRHANDQMGDPVAAILVTEEVLPKIINEPAINDLALRADLAQSLVKISEKLVERADAAKTTDERKTLLDKLDQHLIAMQNPQYIPNAQRETNEVRIRTVREERERLLRDVKRAEGTVIAVEAMNAAIAKGDVDGAYEARRTVVRDFPQLTLDKQLLDLLKEATSLQQKAVKSASTLPSIIEPTEKNVLGRSVLLVKQNGSQINVANEEIHFVKAKQSVYALRVATGEVLWRRHVGAETISDPLRTSVDPGADCVLISPEKGLLARLSALDGKPIWELKIENRLLPPQIDGETLFVSSEAGQVYAIDGVTGQVRWAKQLPQKMETGVGGGLNKPSRYALGQHSNLYALSRNDGSCNEVYYLGHAAGTISVPPVYTLGHLIIFENAGPNYCNMHILYTGEQGDKLSIAQKTIRLTGHVVVPPTLDGRRMVVVTDLGEVNAYDIEPASSGDKVNRVASIGKNENKPRISWPFVAGNELWIASNRLTRYQIQVSKQQLVTDWVREEEDQFSGRPYKFDDYIIHSRVLRGTQGVRVSAVNGVSGDPAWEVDLGVPVVAVISGSGTVSAINSQASLYSITGKSLASGKPLTASENPGRNQRKLDFSSPVVLGNGKTALLNLGQGIQIAVYDPKATPGSSLQVNSLQITSGVPSVNPLAVGSGIVVPLDNTQLAFVDPTNGKQLGAPFQPTLSPGSVTRWISPVLLSDNQTIVTATSEKKMYRLSTGKQLRSLTETETSLPLTGQLSCIDDVICAVARGQSQDLIELYSGSDLSRIAGIEQDGRVTWGPFAVGKQFISGLGTSSIVSVDLTGKVLWKLEIPNVALVGKPTMDGDEILLCSRNGQMFRVDSATGTKKASLELGEPISGTASIVGSQILVPGSEGVLLVVPLDSTRDSSAASFNHQMDSASRLATTRLNDE